MPFKYSCFLSYRASSQPAVHKLYAAFSEELAAQSALLMPDLDVYIDRDRISGGDFFADRLAHALCHSVCMIVLFSPYYFDRGHTYCAREYAGMLALEEGRRARCSRLVSNGYGLIIPVLIRGSLPHPLERERHSYSLADELLAARDLQRRASRSVLNRIAHDAYLRYEALRCDGVDPADTCSDFTLPTEGDVAALVDEMSAEPETRPWRI
jgi:hypothetical protein